jgi:UDP-glucose-4-epimerase GalE
MGYLGVSMTGQGNRVLVVGGGGFIGSHTSKLLASQGFEPVVFDNFSRGHPSLAKFGPVIIGDIHDRAALNEVITAFRPIACMHFAAFAYVAESLINPSIYYWNNVAGSLNLISALVENGIKKLVFSSSCAVYGQAEDLPIRESSPKRPLSPYGTSKLMVETILQDFDKVCELNSVSLRYFNAAGADPEGEIGEVHNPEPHIIPRVLMAAAGVIPFFEINGIDFPTIDGTAIRDYTHVMDLAQAHVDALRYLLRDGATDSFNLGTGRGYSVRDIVASAERVTGSRIITRVGTRRPGDPAEVISDPMRAYDVLRFEPRYPSLDQMISHAWRWFLSHGFAAGQ